MNGQLGIIQSSMHRDFFGKAREAVRLGFYFEAIFIEYAAIEGRLEVILGLLGLPCNKDLDPMVRKDIKISARIQCLNNFRKSCSKVFEKTKLERDFFSDKGRLKSWIRNRNIFIHGLYKNAEAYESRKRESKEIAENGLELAQIIFNETSRIRRLSKSHPVLLKAECRSCQNKKCPASTIAFEKEG